jgi:hypothetical protein
MSGFRGLAAFLYDFVVGDDPVVAVLVVLGLGATAALAGAGKAAWWVLPVAVLAALTWSLLRATRAPR